jgi:kojibiose phosphorylase
METIKKHLKTETGWEVINEHYDKMQAITEGSNFMIGNGYLGYRGTFFEDRKDAYVGCIVTDSWDNADGKWEELATVHNALYGTFSFNKTPFSMDQNILDYSRTLDLLNGLTKRGVKVEINDTIFTLEEEKFASMSDKNVIAMKVQITTSKDAVITLESGIDTDIWSINGHHFQKETPFKYKNDLGTISKTNTYEDTIVVLEKNMVAFGKSVQKKSGVHKRQKTISLKANTPLVWTKFMIVTNSNDVLDPLKEAKTIYDSLISYDTVFTAHCQAWEDIWNKQDIQLEGNMVDQVGIRFNLYHACIATPTHKPLPIGARGLSCQAYQGAAFWDQEVFNLPMFLYTNPGVARQLLKYRYLTLEGAKEKAKKHQYEGAFYAWISGKTGKELCPDFFFKDVITNRDIRNHFNLWQIHISPDIAVSVNKYVEVTKDEDFLIKYGAEMVFEIARFLASRVDYKPRRDRYEIIRVQGPDEYHENVDNNAFTNYQTKITFDIALSYLNRLDKGSIRSIRDKIDLTDDEISLWEDIKDKIYLPTPNKDGVLEQFEGYFDLESIVPASKVTERLIDPEEYYGWPNGIAVFTQCIKQADTIQLLHMYPELFDEETVKANYDYYEPRTLHFSSLSPSVYATVAARMNYLEDGYRLFKKSLMIDLMNTNEAVSGGTFIGGMHTAANAAAWQMVVLGFAGFHYDQHHFSLKPHLPTSWKSLQFNLNLLQSDLRFLIDHHQIQITPLKMNNPISLFINGKEVIINHKDVTINY